MLILTRKLNEAIMIGEDIKITVVEIQGDKVKLGIEAPRELSILREEIYRAVSEENRQAMMNPRGIADIVKQVKEEGK
jgi:carbon storage regulator